MAILLSEADDNIKDSKLFKCKKSITYNANNTDIEKRKNRK